MPAKSHTVCTAGFSVQAVMQYAADVRRYKQGTIIQVSGKSESGSDTAPLALISDVAFELAFLDPRRA
jgi:hypothetical protein